MGTALRILLVLSLFGFTGAFNAGLVEIRLQEIDYLLGRAASEQEVSQALGILAKYELIKRRIEQGEQSVGNYELEAKIQSLISGDRLEQMEKRDKTYLAPVRFVLNGIRLVLGKQIINPTGENKLLHVLEIGYFWERIRRYPDAIKVYNDVLAMPAITPEIRAAVLLHKAFCHSMLSEYETAKGIYERVINQYPETESGVLAWKLLEFIDAMELKRQKVQAQTLTHIERAKQYYLLMDYRNSVKYYSRFLQSAPASREAEARFFKGRSHEELGESDEAIAEYRRVIKEYAGQRWAREANRRMLMLGEFYEQKKQISEEARAQLTAYQDETFMNKVEHFAKMVSESSIRAELREQIERGAGGEAAVPDKQVMDLINSIGDLDLTGETQRKKQAEKLRRELIEQGAMSEAEIAELERKQLLASNPYRRPHALKQIIDDNASQLRYLYNRRLRKGVKLGGKMQVEMHIAPSGAIARVSVVQSNLGDRSFEEDVAEKIKQWRFRPVPDSLGTMTIRYPFEFFEER
jgi:TonB family protein